ncbi:MULTISPECIES: hypothetical protein [unclassified Paenibacillus]|uniref:hypothetical protein n=1 Tax=unclassified Paenibacillus TaxID=185978 RepID=UPI000970BE1E|nr:MULTISPECIES: hypothetical protein [unclassified Paenibacillus]ASS68970.1 hypothetical protein CIC07_24740 [Paenibacillus sp. RUD330]
MEMPVMPQVPVVCVEKTQAVQDILLAASAFIGRLRLADRVRLLFLRFPPEDGKKPPPVWKRRKEAQAK